MLHKDSPSKVALISNASDPCPNGHVLMLCEHQHIITEHGPEDSWCFSKCYCHLLYDMGAAQMHRLRTLHVLDMQCRDIWTTAQ